jgi:hypothetical protein
MGSPGTQSPSDRYTTLSDRFRSLWTFYQFLGGVLKHLDEGPMPYSYDFQALHNRLKELVHKIGLDSSVNAGPELDQLERELDRIHKDLSHIDGKFSPSVMRKFFDHIKGQDEKVLCALLKFYLQSHHFEQDTLDKLDILFTRLGEIPADGGRVAPRDPTDALLNFERLSGFARLPQLPPAEMAPLEEAVLAFKNELESIEDYNTLVESRVYERYRRLKQRLGKTALHPSMLVAITTTNIAAKNRFKDLYEVEESHVVENTKKIYDIERYLDRHPELASDELKQQIEDFRHIRIRYESSLEKNNVKRDHIDEMTRAMRAVLDRFESSSKPVSDTNDISPEPAPSTKRARFAEDRPVSGSDSAEDPELLVDEVDPDDPDKSASLTEVLPPDPLLNETLHKIMFALEMVVWDRLPTQVTSAPEIRNLELESWEVATYRRLAEGKVEKGTAEWELDHFFLTSAALRVKMDEERKDIVRLEDADSSDRLFEILDHSAQSLERARDTDRRFQWFIDDMLFRGETLRLENIYRSRFRFLHAYSGLWLAHQRSGGLTPL